MFNRLSGPALGEDPLGFVDRNGSQVQVHFGEQLSESRQDFTPPLLLNRCGLEGLDADRFFLLKRAAEQQFRGGSLLRRQVSYLMNHAYSFFDCRAIWRQIHHLREFGRVRASTGCLGRFIDTSGRSLTVGPCLRDGLSSAGLRLAGHDLSKPLPECPTIQAEPPFRVAYRRTEHINAGKSDAG